MNHLHNPKRITIVTNQFDSAQQNMSFDQQLLKKHPNNPILRIYTWQKPSITQAFNKVFPHTLLTLDHHQRCTGGGLVFHSPNDILITCIIPLQSRNQKIKNILRYFQSYLYESLSPLRTINQQSLLNTPRNIQSCQHYHSPFELFYNNTKCAAIAARKFSEELMLQCIIHNGDNEYFRKNIPAKYLSYLANPLKICPSQLQESLVENIYKNNFFTHKL